MVPRDPAWIKRTARVAGGLYLALMPFSFFGLIYVPSSLVVSGDAAETARNIMNSEWLFRSATVSHLLGQIIFIFLALALYRLLEPVNRGHAVSMVVLALLSVPISFINEINHLAVLRLLGPAGYLAPFTPAQLQAQAMLFLDLHDSGLLIAQVFWALWLIPLGWLVFKSGFLPRLLGILLIIACAGYLVDVALGMLAPGVGAKIGQLTFVGEVLLPLWLVFKGVNVERWQRVALTRGA